ncbi:MAG: hypothetical protein ACLFR2_01470 [Candidatus Kapaibacterium sp.]
MDKNKEKINVRTPADDPENLDINDENTLEDPFGEVFDPEDVINRKESNISKKKPVRSLSDRHSPDLNKIEPGKISEKDLNRILSYSEEDRLKKDFKPFYEGEDIGEDIKGLISEDDIAELLRSKKDKYNIDSDFESFDSADINNGENAPAKKGSFMDFMQLPKISGGIKRSENKHIIPGDSLKTVNKKIEITDDISEDEHGHRHSSVVINRDETGEVESIEVYCKCGERTLIQFDYISYDEAGASASRGDNKDAFTAEELTFSDEVSEAKDTEEPETQQENETYGQAETTDNTDKNSEDEIKDEKADINDAIKEEDKTGISYNNKDEIEKEQDSKEDK